MFTYYITGISGFLGRNLTIELLKQKDVEIIGLVFPNEKNLEFYEQYPNITLVRGNLLDRESIDSFLSTPSKGDKYLLHVAGRISVYKRNDQLTMDVNVEGTRNVIESCLDKDFKKVIYVSSVDSLPRRKDKEPIYEPNEYTLDKVEGVYSKSKVLANNIVLDAVKNHNLDACIVLPSVLMGPNDPFNSPINAAINKFLNDKLPAITKGGYDVVDVRDVAKGILLAVEKGKAGESYLLTGHNISVKDLIGEAAKVANKDPVKRVAPTFVIKLASPFIGMHARAKHKMPLFTAFAIDCLMQNSNFSYQKANQELGYKPIPLEITMKETIGWLQLE